MIEESLQDVLDELNSLTGLKRVKEEVEQLQGFIKVEKQRRAAGLPTSSMSYHCVFMGAPGTGKTTVARIIGKIYKHLGILSSGKLTETDRSGLIGEYVGHTAIKVDELINSSLDGILFIDEAYSLAAGGENDYGREAIDALIKRIEDYRDRLVVIIAGYPDEMNHFLDTNPGIKSRFNNYIHFDNYSTTELVEIFESLCKKNKYSFSLQSLKQVSDFFEKIISEQDKSFGNAREVRNFFEKTEKKQRLRLAAINNPTKTQLIEFTYEDISNAISEELFKKELFKTSNKTALPENSTKSASDKQLNHEENIIIIECASYLSHGSENKHATDCAIFPNALDLPVFRKYVSLVKQIESDQYIELAEKHKEYGDFEKAFEFYNKAILVTPGIEKPFFAKTYISISIQKIKLLDFIEAKINVEKALHYDPSFNLINCKNTCAETIKKSINEKDIYGLQITCAFLLWLDSFQKSSDTSELCDELYHIFKEKSKNLLFSESELYLSALIELNFDNVLNISNEFYYICAAYYAEKDPALAFSYMTKLNQK